MPASPGSDDQLGARPSRPVTPDAIAEWEARTYPGLRRYAPPAPGEVVLDDVLLELDELLADPELGRTTIADELPRD